MFNLLWQLQHSDKSVSHQSTCFKCQYNCFTTNLLLPFKVHITLSLSSVEISSPTKLRRSAHYCSMSPYMVLLNSKSLHPLFLADWRVLNLLKEMAYNLENLSARARSSSQISSQMSVSTPFPNTLSTWVYVWKIVAWFIHYKNKGCYPCRYLQHFVGRYCFVGSICI